MSFQSKFIASTHRKFFDFVAPDKGTLVFAYLPLNMLIVHLTGKHHLNSNDFAIDRWVNLETALLAPSHNFMI